MTNCPNCGAPIDTYHYVRCPHCHTDYYDFAPMVIGEPFMMKFKHDGKTMIAKVILTQQEVTTLAPDRAELYADNVLISTVCSAPQMSMDIHLEVVPDKYGRLYTLVDAERM